MKNKKSKILVLSDLKESTRNVLKSSVSLAKMVDGDIDFFHVIKPTDVVEKESQLSAFRTINEQHSATKKDIQNFVNPLSEAYGIDINYSYTFGNVKNEIREHIANNKPDIIVLGKRTSKTFKVMGDSITQFVLKEYDGVIMIASDNALEPNKNLSLGFFNDIDESSEFVENLIKHTEAPVKSFKIRKKSDALKEANISDDKKTIEFVFEKNDNTIMNLSNYLSKNNINLLCINRGKKKTANKLSFMSSDIKEAINKLDVSLLLSGGQNFSIQQ
ncbi:universal stress protein [Thalassobellus suaedae]|uniref:Universal stress protein n=1 Tax=Thalassobellus suaedae TaxID=3074124 RepID=A0ABY9Y7G4_9FLAO|nr:universal stress protein [Flavobacteriaceae bacterium HL-DH10]